MSVIWGWGLGEACKHEMESCSHYGMLRFLAKKWRRSFFPKDMLDLYTWNFMKFGLHFGGNSGFSATA